MSGAHAIPASPRFKNRVGQTFGLLRVIAFAGRRKQHSMWKCRCKCGKTTVVSGSNLVRKNTRSCRCLSRLLSLKRFITHNKSKTVEYKIWIGIITRCENPNSTVFGHYGGRGIAMCKRWRSSFSAFLIDMGQRPSKVHSIERINNDGPYSPKNCRWSTRREQIRNTRRCRFLKHNGLRLCLAEWSERTNIPAGTIQGRIARGWTVAAALTKTLAKSMGRIKN